MDSIDIRQSLYIFFLSKENEEMLAASQEIRRIKRSPRIRRCWTELCRKIEDDKKKDKKTKEEPYKKQALMHYTCTSSCFELFIQSP